MCLLKRIIRIIFFDETLPFLTLYLNLNLKNESKSALKSLFKDTFLSLEKELLHLKKDVILEQNLNLNALELKIIEFTMLVREIRQFNNFLDFYKLNSFRETIKFLFLAF